MKFLDTEGLKYYTDKLIAYINEKVSNVDISTKQDKLTAGDNITIDSNNKISARDTKYTHPSTHSASMITETTDKKFMTSAEKTKLSGIATNANYYTHPSSHSANMITENTNKRFVSDAEKTKWNNKIDAELMNPFMRQMQDAVNSKQDKLTAGSYISISSDNTISVGIKILTQSAYDALSSTEKNRSDMLYGVYDG